ncbi:MAG: guanylate kinase [Candidatus Chromulinivorax sp.]|nr:guanylate kinase [Candidatus Chromulinivorax sp.]
MKEQQGALFIVSGPSGVGKTTVVTEFLRRYGQDYQVSRMVTYTTKVPRSTEVHGADYHFITQSEFERKIADGFFLEWSGEYGACYGTPVHVVEDVSKGQSFILVIDRVGAAQVIAKYPHVVLIWIQISSMDMLSDRLNARKTESIGQIQTRLFLAKKEIEQEAHFPMYHYHVMNDELKSAVEGISAIITSRCIPVKRDIF